MTDEELRRLRELAEAARDAPIGQISETLEHLEMACDPQTILSLLDRLKAAEANQRTKGCQDICSHPNCLYRPDGFDPEYPERECGYAKIDGCPLRTKDTP